LPGGYTEAFKFPKDIGLEDDRKLGRDYLFLKYYQGLPCKSLMKVIETFVLKQEKINIVLYLAQ